MQPAAMRTAPTPTRSAFRKARAGATDMETGEAVKGIAPHTFRFDLKKHDFKVLVVK